MKMYILIKESLPTSFALVAAAHASLAAYKRFDGHPHTQTWISETFFKVICKVDDAEFERAKDFDDHVIISESARNDEEVAIAFRPRPEEDWPKAFKFFRLYR